MVWLAWLPVGEAVAARLRYEAPRAADRDCPSRKRFADEVSARLGFSPWSAAGARVRVRIDAGEVGFVGSIATAGGRRPKTFAADSCRKVADLLVTATSIALDRMDPATREGAPNDRRARDDVTRGRNIAPPMSETLAMWSFADRNNRYQAGGIFATMTGAFGLTAAAPIGRGHVQASYARSGSSSESYSSSRWELHAYYLLPVFYINENSMFEVPVFAGGGLAYQSYSFDQMTGTDTEESKVLPVLAGGWALQFRGLPIEFVSQMTFSLLEPPVGTGRMGFNFAFRYVFGR
jgi:hypothetical protein